MMKRLVLVFAACLLMAGVATADMTVMFFTVGAGNMVADVGSVIYSGQIVGGDLAPGIWSIAIDDTGWPVDPGPRWDYIWNTFYEYDPAGSPPVWTATFDTPLLATRPELYIEETGVGSMSGVADMRFQVIDWDEDGVLDADECAGDGLSGVVIIIEDGTGYYAALCGDGTYEGGYTRDCGTFHDDVQFQMTIDLYGCGMATEPASWGAIKALYQ
jgi:hypothetical protein